MSFAADLYWFIEKQHELFKIHSELGQAQNDIERDRLNEIQSVIIKQLNYKLKKVATIHMQNKIVNKMIIERI